MNILCEKKDCKHVFDSPYPYGICPKCNDISFIQIKPVSQIIVSEDKYACPHCHFIHNDDVYTKYHENGKPESTECDECGESFQITHEEKHIFTTRPTEE